MLKKNSKMDKEKDTLIELAFNAQKKAYAPYSKHGVGASILTINGKYYNGCNVENSVYPEGVCAEASAISAMILDGEDEIDKIYIKGPRAIACFPCGGCRQKIIEFSNKSTQVFVEEGENNWKSYSITDILPSAFTSKNL